MRVAIFHDYFGAIGGGERLILTLARAWDATVYTTDIHRPSIERLGFDDVRLVSLGSLVPRAPLKQVQASLKFARTKVDADAFVISGNWAVHASRRHHPNLFYCNTPVRAFYDLRDHVIRLQRSVVHRALTRGWIAVHGAWDRIAWSHVDQVVANSENTSARIRTFLGRDAPVIYPPTDVSRYRFEALGNFWLSVNRLYPEKRLEVQFDAFRRLPRERLVVVGGYNAGDHASEYAKRLQPPPNVELRGEVDEAELAHLYAQCRGLICTAQDEDFGMTPVEAMASGKTVLAVDEGGYRETIVSRETGWLLPADGGTFASTITSLSDADLLARAEACRRRAERFDVSRFLDGMGRALKDMVS